MISRIAIPLELLKQIEAEARAACPRECCGLLVGQRLSDVAEVFLAHPAANIAESDDRFEIDPRAQFTLLRALRGTDREIVGCYHSHPNGRPEPSARDAGGASEAGFLWLISAIDAQGTCIVAGFVFGGDRFVPVEICER